MLRMSRSERVFSDQWLVSFVRALSRRLFLWLLRFSEVFMMSTERTKFSIRKNDQVQVIAGREKGKTGKVLTINRNTGRVTIEKVNMVKRHVKPSQKYPGGGIIEKELPLHYSNVLLFCT